MKKLMTIAAAALCTTVFGAIESTNVVGYQNSKVANGDRAMRTAATFLLVGENPTAIKISDIKQTAGDPGDLILCLYNDNVTRQAMYMYLSEAVLEEAELVGYAEGWYRTEDGADPDLESGVQNADLPYGQGCVINSFNGDAKYTSQGQVDKIKREFSVGNGARKMMGNMLPRAVNLSEIKQSAGDPGDLIFCTYDNNVTRQAMYMYLSEEVLAEAELVGYEAGWYLTEDGADPDLESGVQDFVIPAGHGFVINSFNGDAVLKFPTAL